MAEFSKISPKIEHFFLKGEVLYNLQVTLFGMSLDLSCQYISSQIKPANLKHLKLRHISD